MRHHLHKTLSAACSLNVSILSEMPENSRIQSSEYDVEENNNGQFIKTSSPIYKHERFRSLLEPRWSKQEEDNNIKCSMLTDTRIEYFDAIEKALLVENQNLKNHNKFLIDQVQKLYQRQKRLKKDVIAKQLMMESLKEFNKELEITVQILSNDIMIEIQSLQHLLTTRQSHQKNSSYRVKTFQDFDSADINSGNIVESIETMKQIFSKEVSISQQTQEESDCAAIRALNPERQYEYIQHFSNLDSMKYNKALNYTENMRRKMRKNIINHPILKDLEDKITDLNKDLTMKAKINRKTTDFKKLKTMGI